MRLAEKLDWKGLKWLKRMDRNTKIPACTEIAELIHL
jgi:hypothetical protein